MQKILFYECEIWKLSIEYLSQNPAVYYVIQIK